MTYVDIDGVMKDLNDDLGEGWTQCPEDLLSAAFTRHIQPDIEPRTTGVWLPDLRGPYRIQRCSSCGWEFQDNVIRHLHRNVQFIHCPRCGSVNKLA